MKRYIKSSELPSGYLGTNKFSVHRNLTDDEMNVVEAFEIAVTEKFDQFDRFCDIQLHLTSGSSWIGEVYEYEAGYWIKLSATRSGFQAFVSGDHVIRKPRNAGELIATYQIEGERGTIYYVREER